MRMYDDASSAPMPRILASHDVNFNGIEEEEGQEAPLHCCAAAAIQFNPIALGDDHRDLIHRS
ncbi:MAG: hypothetical protein HYX76_09595 [Acidobacteria bacterium]|nr:hypothetical protein [Acidobacteriota bacterium]